MTENENGLQGYPPSEPLSEDQVAVDPSTEPEPTPNTEPVDFDVEAEVEPAATEDHDEEDVAAALARETSDGSGFTNENELPKPDFESFAEPDVEEQS